MATKCFTSSSFKISKYLSIFGIYSIMSMIQTKFLTDQSYNNDQKFWSVSRNKS